VALAKLPSDQREALLLVGASGFSYEERRTDYRSIYLRALASASCLRKRSDTLFLVAPA
jgi:hypothetical protein